MILAVRDAVDDLADRIVELAVEAEYAQVNLCEMILVDDGSRDLTWAVLQSLVRHEPRLRPIRLRNSFGPAAAREAGVLMASGDIVITIEADAPVTHLGQLVGLIEADHDLVMARRGGRKGWAVGTAAFRREVIAALMDEGLPLAALPLAARRQGYRLGEVRMAAGSKPGLPDAIGLLGAIVPALLTERLAGFGMLLGTAVMLAAVPLLLLPIDGLAAVAALLAGLQIAGISALGSLLLLRCGRRARVQSRIAETLLGHGARD